MNKKNKSFVMPTYGTKKLKFLKGKGCYLYNNNNEKYLDFASGIAVNSLGHCHPRLVSALLFISSSPKDALASFNSTFLFFK